MLSAVIWRRSSVLLTSKLQVALSLHVERTIYRYKQIISWQFRLISMLLVPSKLVLLTQLLPWYRQKLGTMSS